MKLKKTWKKWQKKAAKFREQRQERMTERRAVEDAALDKKLKTLKENEAYWRKKAAVKAAEERVKKVKASTQPRVTVNHAGGGEFFGGDFIGGNLFGQAPSGRQRKKPRSLFEGL